MFWEKFQDAHQTPGCWSLAESSFRFVSWNGLKWSTVWALSGPKPNYLFFVGEDVIPTTQQRAIKARENSSISKKHNQRIYIFFLQVTTINHHREVSVFLSVFLLRSRWFKLILIVQISWLWQWDSLLQDRRFLPGLLRMWLKWFLGWRKWVLGGDGGVESIYLLKLL